MQKKLLQTLAFATMFTANVGVLTDAHAGLEDDYIECIRKIGCHPIEGECTEDIDSRALKANIIKETKDATWGFLRSPPKVLGL